jgi:hypothetical protein
MDVLGTSTEVDGSSLVNNNSPTKTNGQVMSDSSDNSISKGGCWAAIRSFYTERHLFILVFFLFYRIRFKYS